MEAEGITKEDYLNIDVGDKILFIPNMDNPEDFERTSQYEVMQEHDLDVIEINIIANGHGFKNKFDYEIKLIKRNGEYLTDFEYFDIEAKNEEELKRENEVFSQTSTDSLFLGYLSKYTHWMTLTTQPH